MYVSMFKDFKCPQERSHAIDHRNYEETRSLLTAL